MAKLKGKVTQAMSKVYTPEKIAEKTANGTHRGENMQEIFNHIMQSPVVIHERQENGVVNMKMKLKDGNTKDVGWYDMSRNMGWIDQSAYDHIKKMEEKAKERGIGPAQRDATGETLKGSRIPDASEFDGDTIDEDDGPDFD